MDLSNLTDEQHSKIFSSYLARISLEDAKRIFQAVEAGWYAGANLGMSSQINAHNMLDAAVRQAIVGMLPHDKCNIERALANTGAHLETQVPN